MERGKDRRTLDDIEEDVRKFVGGRSPAGQAATAFTSSIGSRASCAPRISKSARVRVFVEHADDHFVDVVRARAASAIKAGSLDVSVQNMDVQKARPIVDEQFDVPSEVDDFWTRFRGRVLPAVKKRQPMIVEARLSEPPDVRRRIAEDAAAQLVRRGR